jgi:hypothetical protein
MKVNLLRKPPPVIHSVLKCVFYIFGKKRKQLKLWGDMTKVNQYYKINSSLLTWIF